MTLECTCAPAQMRDSTKNTLMFLKIRLTHRLHLDDRIPSVTTRRSCSAVNESNCYSRESLLQDSTCEFKRHNEVNYAFNSGVGKHSYGCKPFVSYSNLLGVVI